MCTEICHTNCPPNFDGQLCWESFHLPQHWCSTHRKYFLIIECFCEGLFLSLLLIWDFAFTHHSHDVVLGVILAMHKNAWALQNPCHRDNDGFKNFQLVQFHKSTCSVPQGYCSEPYHYVEVMVRSIPVCNTLSSTTLTVQMFMFSELLSLCMLTH